MRGDIYELRHDRQNKGHEQSDRRYAVVVQSDALMLSTVLAAPTSTRSWDAPFHPEITLLGQRTLVLLEQLQVVDPDQRFGHKVGRISDTDHHEIDQALKLVLGLY